MRVFRRIMLCSGLDIDSLPETRKLRYTATTKVEPVKGSLGSTIIANKWDSITNEGVIVCVSDITTIGADAFRECTSLTSVTIPDSVTWIGDSAFSECTSLKSATIGNSVTSIGYGLFNYCTSLTSVTIPNSVTSIGSYAFSYCTSLTSITIPDSVTWISGRAFWGCDSLTSITIPGSVTSIGEYAFYYCSSLTSVYCKATTPPSLRGTAVFDKNGSGRIIYVPTESVDAYNAATNWSTYADSIVGYDFEDTGSNELITFTIDGIECQAEEGMSFYDWALSDYFDESAPLKIIVDETNLNLREQIVQQEVNHNDNVDVYNPAGFLYEPNITTGTLIQPVAYNVAASGFD